MRRGCWGLRCDVDVYMYLDGWVGGWMDGGHGLRFHFVSHLVPFIPFSQKKRGDVHCKIN